MPVAFSTLLNTLTVTTAAQLNAPPPLCTFFLNACLKFAFFGQLYSSRQHGTGKKLRSGQMKGITQVTEPVCGRTGRNQRRPSRRFHCRSAVLPPRERGCGTRTATRRRARVRPPAGSLPFRRPTPSSSRRSFPRKVMVCPSRERGEVGCRLAGQADGHTAGEGEEATPQAPLTRRPAGPARWDSPSRTVDGRALL